MTSSTSLFFLVTALSISPTTALVEYHGMNSCYGVPPPHNGEFCIGEAPSVVDQDSFEDYVIDLTKKCWDKHDREDTSTCDRIQQCIDPCDERLNFCNSKVGGSDTGKIVCDNLDCFPSDPNSDDPGHCLDSTDHSMEKPYGGLILQQNYKPVFEAEASGDPHFKTWNGNWFDFHGQCDLVLTQAPNFAQGLGLQVHVRTKIRYQYSYIESAAIQIGEDVLEVGPYGDYAINQVDSARLPKTLLDSKATITHHQKGSYQHSFNITLPDQFQIQLGSFKDLVFVKIHAQQEQHFKHFQNSQGLLGSFNQNGAMLSRDGSTLLKEQPNQFGIEWQVQNTTTIFRTPQEPQYPQPCILPSTINADTTRRGRRLGEAMAVGQACQHWGEKKQLCIFDTMATRDFDLAKAGPF